MKKLFILLIAVVFLLVAVPVFAISVTQTGTTVTISYDEPTTNEDDSPLDDLAKCVITNSFDTQSIDVPATSVNGGGIGVSQVIDLAVLAGQQVNVNFEVRACDLSGNCSVPATLSIRLDRLAPAGVQ